MRDEFIDEDFLLSTFSNTEKAQKKLKINARFDLFSGILLLLLSSSFLILFAYVFIDNSGFSKINELKKVETAIFSFLTVSLLFILFFAFFKIKAFITVQKILQNTSTNSLEQLFKEQGFSAIFLSLASVTSVLVIIILFYAVFTNQF